MDKENKKRKTRKIFGVWEKDEIVKLIKLIERNEQLWDCSRKDYKDRVLRNRNFKNIAEELNKDIDDCINKWNSLRKCETKRSRQSTVENYQSRWEYFSLLQFLKKYVPSSSFSNMVSFL